MDAAAGIGGVMPGDERETATALAEKYIELRTLAFRTAQLYTENDQRLSYDVKAIARWLYVNETAMYKARLEELWGLREDAQCLRY